MPNTGGPLFIDPRFNQVKLFNRLYVMSGIGPGRSLGVVKTEISATGDEIGLAATTVPFDEKRQDVGKTGEGIHEPLSTIRHARRIVDVGPGIADEHISVRHLDSAQPLGVEGPLRRQEAVQVQNVS